ncbi:MAG: TPM domain-containing protein [Planctomycetes bacterium]|nr:TPM domain-containing protein [Planctomycetota bacterium]
MVRSTNPRKFLSEAESARINSAIKEAESKTSGEIKVVMARHCWSKMEAKAAKIFRELGLDKTKERNCVLILFIVTNREFLIHGDQGIHDRVGQGFWDDIRDKMTAAFKQDEFGVGISQGVCLIGERLSEYFPYQRDDTDEISNEIVYKN